VLLVGWRLLNPLFVTVAVAGYSLAIALVGNHFFGGRLNSLEAEIVCAVLHRRADRWRPGMAAPSHDRMLDGLCMPRPGAPSRQLPTPAVNEPITGRRRWHQVSLP
jgi:hypothetical protein